MKKVRRGYDLLSEEDRDKVIKEIIAYFHAERDQEIGVIAAADILDFFLQATGERIYNKAITDVQALFRKKLEEWDFELDLLRKQ